MFGGLGFRVWGQGLRGLGFRGFGWFWVAGVLKFGGLEVPGVGFWA